MAKILENIGKEILKANGVPTTDFRVANNVIETINAADEIGYPVVIKALVAVGKRGKAGGVKIAKNSTEAEQIANDILSMTVHNFPVTRLLVEQKLSILKELYVSITFDSSERVPVVIASRSGGVDIEEVAKRSPKNISKSYINIKDGFHIYKAKEMWSDLEITGSILPKASQILWRIYKIFEKYDASIVEINPLAITSQNELVAASILMGVDDDALYRQPYIIKNVEEGSDRVWRPLTELEKQMIAVDKEDSYRGTARYTEMDGGDIGFLCGGGGGSLLVYDELIRFGGKPANYTEFGGNPPERKVTGLVKGILSKPGVKGFCMATNITNNTQTDVVARGIIKAFRDMKIDITKFPIVIRFAGVNEEKTKKLFAEARIEYHGEDITMGDAAKLIVNKMKETY